MMMITGHVVVAGMTPGRKVPGSIPALAAGNVLFHGQLSVLTFISVSVPPPCYRNSTGKFPVILPKVQVAGYS